MSVKPAMKWLSSLFQTKRRRREALMAEPFPEHWRGYLERHVALYPYLPKDDRERLERFVQIFLAEKNLEGCGGLRLTDEIRLAVAGHACLLLLHLDHDFFPLLQSVLVYPETFLAPDEQEGPDGVVAADPDPREGESWDRGAVVLSWESVLAPPEEWGPSNVILHEFAHQLDWETGEMDGVPFLPDADLHEEWSRVCRREFERLERAAEISADTLMDPYGATEPAEFFAVATETFFMAPAAFRDAYPALYQLLQRYYRQDPAALVQRQR